MGVVTIGTDHLAFTDWVVRIFDAIRTLFLVAGKAHLGLSLLVAYFIVRRVAFVARGTSYVADLVGAARPVSAFQILIVAGKTSGVLRCRWRSAIRRVAAALGAKQHVRSGAGCLAFGILDVGIALAVAGLAGRGAGVALDAVLGGKDRQYRSDFALIMTLGAYRIPVQVIGCCLVSFSLHLRRRRFAHIGEIGCKYAGSRP